MSVFLRRNDRFYHYFPLPPSGSRTGSTYGPCNSLAALRAARGADRASRSTSFLATNEHINEAHSQLGRPSEAAGGRPSLSVWESLCLSGLCLLWLCLAALAGWLVCLACLGSLWLSSLSILRAKRQVSWDRDTLRSKSKLNLDFQGKSSEIPWENALKIGFLAPKWAFVVPKRHRKSRGSQP